MGDQHRLVVHVLGGGGENMSLRVLPVASKTLPGCQLMERTVALMVFLRNLETRQLLSSSNERFAIALVTIGQGWKT